MVVHVAQIFYTINTRADTHGHGFRGAICDNVISSEGQRQRLGTSAIYKKFKTTEEAKSFLIEFPCNLIFFFLG